VRSALWVHLLDCPVRTIRGPRPPTPRPGFARDGKPWFWIREGEPAAGVHVAFRAADSETVDAFYAAAIGAGGEDGAPGLREHYHPTYSAFAHNPDGNNDEAVHHG